MKITDVLFWIFFLLALIFVGWYVFGDSPTLEQAILVVLTTLVIKMYGELKESKGDYQVFKKNVELSFRNAKEEMSELKELIKPRK